METVKHPHKDQEVTHTFNLPFTCQSEFKGASGFNNIVVEIEDSNFLILECAKQQRSDFGQKKSEPESIKISGSSSAPFGSPFGPQATYQHPAMQQFVPQQQQYHHQQQQQQHQQFVQQQQQQQQFVQQQLHQHQQFVPHQQQVFGGGIPGGNNGAPAAQARAAAFGDPAGQARAAAFGAHAGQTQAASFPAPTVQAPNAFGGGIPGGNNGAPTGQTQAASFPAPTVQAPNAFGGGIPGGNNGAPTGQTQAASFPAPTVQAPIAFGGGIPRAPVQAPAAFGIPGGNNGAPTAQAQAAPFHNNGAPTAFAIPGGNNGAPTGQAPAAVGDGIPGGNNGTAPMQITPTARRRDIKRGRKRNNLGINMTFGTFKNPPPTLPFINLPNPNNNLIVAGQPATMGSLLTNQSLVLTALHQQEQHPNTRQHSKHQQQQPPG